MTQNIGWSANQPIEQFAEKILYPSVNSENNVTRKMSYFGIAKLYSYKILTPRKGASDCFL